MLEYKLKIDKSMLNGMDLPSSFLPSSLQSPQRESQFALETSVTPLLLKLLLNCCFAKQEMAFQLTKTQDVSSLVHNIILHFNEKRPPFRHIWLYFFCSNNGLKHSALSSEIKKMTEID